MAREIERKFLVASDAWRESASPGIAYRQGYLAADERCAVRVRIGGGEAFLTIKGKTTGAARAEYEYPVPVEDAEEMLATLCLGRGGGESCGGIIDKVRHRVEHAGLTWEIDVFRGDNEGLVLAEVELEDEAQPVALPPWAGPEVTADPRYYNAHLMRHPYRTWR